MNEEFDRCLPESEENPPDLSMKRRGLPDDFSEEERAFVRELDSFFAIDKEDIPPYFVQTLLASEDLRFQPVDPEFEKRTCARVFHQLGLHHPANLPRQLELYHQPEPRRRQPHSRRSPARTPANVLAISRSFIAAVACMLILITALSTNTAFTSSLSPLLLGEHGGRWLPSKSAPLGYFSSSILVDCSVVPCSDSGADKVNQLDLSDTQMQLQFPVYEPLQIPKNYVQKGAYLYQGLDQRLADGPALELNYDKSVASEVPQDAGRITIYEFKPKEMALLTIRFGATTHQIEIDPRKPSAIFVDGRWLDNGSIAPWVYNERSALIYGQDGVVFWITQSNGVGSEALDTLHSLATSLQIFGVVHVMHMGNSFGDVTPFNDGTPLLFADDAIYVNSQDGPSLSIFDAEAPLSLLHLPGSMLAARR